MEIDFVGGSGLPTFVVVEIGISHVQLTPFVTLWTYIITEIVAAFTVEMVDTIQMMEK